MGGTTAAMRPRGPGAAPCVLAAASHYGRAEVVVVSVCQTAPVLLERTRILLIEPGLPRAPYHHEALQMAFEQAMALVCEVRQSVLLRAQRAVADLSQRHALRALVIEASPFAELPEALAPILQSRRLTNAADGMLYREAMAVAGGSAGLDVVRTARKSDHFARAAEALAVPRQRIVSLVDELGRPFGPPWRKDHKEATAAAITVLCRYADVVLA